jgi:DNA polymerase-3 subunit delta
VFYLFHGEDEFGREEELVRLRSTLATGDPAMAELNTTVLDGDRVTLSELHHVCDSIPFMAQRRLVIVHGLLSRLASGHRGGGRDSTQSPAPSRKQELDDLVSYLPQLPPTTRLIFVEDKALPTSHPIFEVIKAESKKEQAFTKLFKRPREGELPTWVQRRAQSKGGAFGRQAATTLAALIGSDLRLLDQEIEKLLLYAEDREVNVQDVEVLVSRARETSIFDMVDCVGQRQADRALILLHRLLDEGEPPLYLLAMLARQIRILIQISDLQSQQLTHSEIASRLKLHPYVVEKGMAQARHFSTAQLEAAHQHVVDADWSIKTGDTDPVLALDLLVAELSRD